MTSRKSCKRPAPENECDNPRQRRRRTAFRDEQLDRLEESFQEERFPGIQIREELARQLEIGEDRIQVWFQNRRARWRKHEIKNKPAPPLPASKNRPASSFVVPPAMYQPSPASLPPLQQTSLRPWSQFYPAFTSSATFFPPVGLGSSGVFQRETSFPLTVGPDGFHRVPSFPCASSQTVSVMVRPRVSAAVSPPFSPSSLPDNHLKTQYQASSDLDSRKRGYSCDDYLAAVTLASGFQREN